MTQAKYWDGSSWQNVIVGPQGFTGPTGPTGSSGITSVTSPILNTGTSTAAALSFDSTYLANDSEWGFRKFVPTGSAVVYGVPTSLGNTSLSSTANTVFYMPFVVNDTVIAASLSVYLVTAGTSGTLRLGIYGSDSNDKPSNLILDAGTVSVASGNILTITTYQTLTAGLYWLASVAVISSGTPAVVGAYSNSVLPFTPGLPMAASSVASWQESSPSGTLPSTAAPSVVAQTYGPPLIWVGF